MVSEEAAAANDEDRTERGIHYVDNEFCMSGEISVQEGFEKEWEMDRHLNY
jgi:hypothetical protein